MTTVPSVPPPRRGAPEPIRRSWLVPVSWLLVGLVILLVVVMRSINRTRAATTTTTAPAAPAPANPGY